MKQGQYLPTQLALMTEYVPESRYSVSVEEGSQQVGTPPPPPPPILSPTWWLLFTWQQCLFFSYVVVVGGLKMATRATPHRMADKSCNSFW